MGKAVKTGLKVALVAGAAVLAFVPGAAPAAAAIIASTLGVSAAVAATIVAVGTSLSFAVGSTAFLPGARRGGLVAFDPKAINIDKASPRKLVFGQTLFPLDLRYAEPSSDTRQEYFSYVFALAAHKSQSVDSIYIEDKLAWTSAGGAQGIYAGYLTVEVRLEAGAGATHTVEAGATWNGTTRLTGCTTIKVQVKRSDNSKTSQSPFASGIAGRWSVIGKGMPVYDPARDSTVPGGSGSQRANDCTTWAYTATVDRGNNPALQLLAYLLGWRVNGVVSVGLGIPPARLNLPSFAAAAAICDEAVALAAGGSHRRYEAGKAYTDADDPAGVITELLDAMNGYLAHDGGRLALRLATNDLTAEVALNEDDFLSAFEWSPQPDLGEQFTVVRGRFAQPGAPSLYSLADYPDVATGRAGTVPRVLALELPAVQDIRRAERIATQVARRSMHAGTLTVTLGVRGWLLRQHMVVSVTSAARGITNKLFRVRGLTLNPDATVTVELREEAASIYSWATSETGNLAPVSPVTHDTRLAASWLMAGIEPAATRNADIGDWASLAIGAAIGVGDEAQDQGSTWGAISAHSKTAMNGPPTLPTTSNATWRLRAKVGDTGPAGPSGPTGQDVALGFSASSIIRFTLGPSGSRLVSGQAILDVPTGSGSAYVQIEYREEGGSWTASNGATETYDVGEPAQPAHEVIVSNGNPVAAAFEVRGTCVRSNTNSGPLTASRSKLFV